MAKKKKKKARKRYGEIFGAGGSAHGDGAPPGFMDMFEVDAPCGDPFCGHACDHCMFRTMIRAGMDIDGLEAIGSAALEAIIAKMCDPAANTDTPGFILEKRESYLRDPNCDEEGTTLGGVDEYEYDATFDLYALKMLRVPESLKREADKVIAWRREQGAADAEYYNYLDDSYPEPARTAPSADSLGQPCATLQIVVDNEGAGHLRIIVNSMLEAPFKEYLLHEEELPFDDNENKVLFRPLVERVLGAVFI